jgi:hypothetical protein
MLMMMHVIFFHLRIINANVIIMIVNFPKQNANRFVVNKKRNAANVNNLPLVIL